MIIFLRSKNAFIASIYSSLSSNPETIRFSAAAAVLPGAETRAPLCYMQNCLCNRNYSAPLFAAALRLAHVGGQRRFAPCPPHKNVWFSFETQAIRPSNHTFLWGAELLHVTMLTASLFISNFSVTVKNHQQSATWMPSACVLSHHQLVAGHCCQLEW